MERLLHKRDSELCNRERIGRVHIWTLKGEQDAAGKLFNLEKIYEDNIRKVETAYLIWSTQGTHDWSGLTAR